jgi:hypothetical protein
MKENSQNEMLFAWDQLLASTEANQEDLPHLGSLRARLSTRVEELRCLQSERNLLRGELQNTTEEIRQALAHCQDLASRLRSGVKGIFGIHSERLLEFGIKPIRGRGRRLKAKPRAVCRESGSTGSPASSSSESM